MPALPNDSCHNTKITDRSEDDLVLFVKEDEFRREVCSRLVNI